MSAILAELQLEVVKLYLLRGAMLLLCGLAAWAGPREFGLQNYDAAVRARGLKPERSRVRAVIDAGVPESFRIRGQVVSGGDLRGLMYGLLEAARQIREEGRLGEVSRTPAHPVRGVRVRREELPTGEALRELLATLATMRFNTLFVLPEPPAELRPAAAAYGLKLAAGAALDGVLDVELPVEGTAIPWADPVSVKRILSEVEVRCLRGFAVPARLPLESHELFYAVWGLAGYDPEIPAKNFASLLRARFGKAADSAWAALMLASRCLTFVPPSRFLVTPDEAAAAPATARYTPLQLATAYHMLARDAEDALLPFKTELAAVQPLIDYGRMRARELLALEAQSWYRSTGHDSALYLARREFKGAAARVEAVKSAGLPVAAILEVQEMESSIAGEPTWRPMPPQVKFTHVTPKGAMAGKPVTLSLAHSVPGKAARVLLHWHDGERFHVEESSASRPQFTIVPEAGVLYYFEVVAHSGSGWFYPDPLSGAGYLRLNVRSATHP